MENNLQTICEALSNKKSVLIKVLNVRDLTSIADYFVLCSTRNQKQSQPRRMKWKKRWQNSA